MVNNSYIQVDQFLVKKINSKVATEVIVKHHYLHRKCNILFAFGLIRKCDRKIIGVVTFGNPASPMVCKGICGVAEADKVIELNRLVISDASGKNAESYLVSKALKQLKRLTDKDIIVSYADSSQRHVGYIYQACNFYYTGLSAKHKDYKNKDGSSIHPRHFEERNDKHSASVIYEERSRKFRYVYFNCSKARRKYLLRILKYPIVDYPKDWSLEYV